MKTHGIINADLMHAITSLGHKDLVMIVDAGFPIPKDAWKIDLAITLGYPKLSEVLDAIMSEILVEEILVAEEVFTDSPRAESIFTNLVKDFPTARISHDEFKELAKDAYVIVRTGEATPYANIALRCGVDF